MPFVFNIVGVTSLVFQGAFIGSIENGTDSISSGGNIQLTITYQIKLFPELRPFFHLSEARWNVPKANIGIFRLRIKEIWKLLT